MKTINDLKDGDTAIIHHFHIFQEVFIPMAGVVRIETQGAYAGKIFLEHSDELTQLCIYDKVIAINPKPGDTVTF